MSVSCHSPFHTLPLAAMIAAPRDVKNKRTTAPIMHHFDSSPEIKASRGAYGDTDEPKSTLGIVVFGSIAEVTCIARSTAGRRKRAKAGERSSCSRPEEVWPRLIP